VFSRVGGVVVSRDDIEQIQSVFRQLAGHPERWETVDPEVLCQFAYTEILRYEITGDEALVPDLMALYHTVARRASPEQRQRLKDHVSEFLEQARGTGNALLPFIYCDPSFGIVSSAALDLAVLMPLVDDDPLTGPKYLRHMAEELTYDQDQRVGLLAGLLALGDSRTLPILHGCWELLDLEHQQQLARTRREQVFASVITVFLDWLDACIESGDDGPFGTIAALLSTVVLYEQEVVDYERKYPVWADDDRPIINVTGRWSIAEYGQIIAPRLRSLYERETEPKVMHHVMHYWGVAMD
jgi:hypothetical protein